ncbi:hypothetical protein [Sporolituus thermophilus]|uniref:Porin n=1 Tax=Sporolituus thermophilus DSM 23256 TaxID=1123285 RepID=A0A1G7P697_9FIRM|nr:hypothetical protein [Sporolituus thermophilus]SDF81667.1 hypothetical protein SAMN05660235_02844 [Sporolituus thermophilus DSM 23256]
MKKKLLAATVLAALTFSSASVFAAPVFSGDANIEYNKDEGQKATLTNRIRLVADADIVENFYIHGRMVMNNNLKGEDSSAVGNRGTEAEQIYLGARFTNLDLKVGKQPLWLGKGLLADVNGISGVSANTVIDGIGLVGFFGKDAKQDVFAADMNAALGAANFGASYLKKEDVKRYGLNFDTKLAENTVFNFEYVKNTTNKADGYLAEVKFGNAVKKGDIDYALSYRNIEADAIDGYTTNGNYIDSKGFRVKANYKISDASTLTVYQDIAQTENGNQDKNRTNVEFVVNF